MIFASVRQAIGYYAAKVRGPGYRGATYERVQTSRIDGWEAMEVVRAMVDAGCNTEDIERLIEWSTEASDVPLSPRLGALVGEVAVLLRNRDVLAEPVRPLECEYTSFVDANTGKMIQTRKLRDE